LLQWLNTYTFPYESRFSDTAFAETVYSKAVARHLRLGSTTVVYFGTIHLEGTKVLVNTVEKLGQRAFIGKVNMDLNSPDTYIEETEASLQDTETFIEYVTARDSYKEGLITPTITPRFVPSCTPELMEGLAKLAEKYSLPIQSHISENREEVLWVKGLHGGLSYAGVYDKFGLLTKKTIMAHAVYLTEDEKLLLKEKEVGIAHCPLSNIALDSGFMSFRDITSHKLKVGLGTDVSGGYSPSMLSAIRSALVAGTVHHVLGEEKPPPTSLSWKEAFHLATVGGSEVIGCEDKLGNFIPGKEFDALLIDPLTPNSPFDIFEETPMQTFEKFIFLGDDRNIVKIFVKGKELQV